MTQPELTTIGAYRLESLLGAGGVGQVFRARHTGTGQVAAVKLLRAEISAAGAEDQFRASMQAVSALHHPHLVEVRDWGVDDGRCFVAMELLDGSLCTLLQRRATRPWPLALGLDLVRQAALALDVVHQHGLVHQNLKPENLLLDTATSGPAALYGYLLKIADLGLAQLGANADVSGSGVIAGTPAYLSPEQCQGFALDGRSDMYTLGVVLYEIATGFPPFATQRLADAIAKHVYAQPTPPRQVRPDLPAALDDVILRCLAKQPDQRYATAGALADALQTVLVPLGVPVRPPMPEPVPTPVPLPTLAPVPSVDVQPEIAPRTPTPVEQRPQIQVLDRQGRLLQTAALTGDGLAVGRAENSDLRLDAPAVAALHAQIDWDGVQATITDDGSSGGTARDGVLLMPHMAHPWQFGTPLQVGPFVLKLTEAGATDTPAVLVVPIVPVVPDVAPPAPPTPAALDSGPITPVVPPAPQRRFWQRAPATMEAAPITPVVPPAAQPGFLQRWVNRSSKAARAQPPAPLPVAVPIATAFVAVPAGVAPIAPLPVAPQTNGVAAANLPSTYRSIAPGTLNGARAGRGMTNVGANVGRIGVVLDQDVLVLTPGQAASCTLTLINLGNQVDHLSISVEGVPRTWMPGHIEPVQLNPGAQGTVKLVVNVPRVPESYARDYAVTIRARSRQNTSESGTAPATWTVLPFTACAFDLKPRRVSARRSAHFTASLGNAGNAPTRYTINGEDDDQTLNFLFNQDDLTLEPGQTARIKLRARKRLHWVGATESSSFTVYARSVEEGSKLAATGQFIQPALFPTWLLPIALISLVSALLWMFGILPTTQPQRLKWVPLYCVFCARPQLDKHEMALREGQDAIITGEHLLVRQDAMQSADLKYKLKTSPPFGVLKLGSTLVNIDGAFTQADINSQKLHLALPAKRILPSAELNATREFTFTFTYQDPKIEPATGVFTYTVAQWGVPRLEAKTLAVAQGATIRIGTDELHLAHVNNPPASTLVYTLTALPKTGDLLLDGIKLDTNQNKTFSQADIDADQLTFVQNKPDPLASDAFAVEYSDGYVAPAKAVIDIIVLTPTPIPEPPTPAPIEPTPASVSIPPTSTPLPPTATPLPTATPTTTPRPSAEACVIDDAKLISGKGTPYAPFLVYFGPATRGGISAADRVITGGTIRADGTFDIKITIGNEAPGNYRILVLERDTKQVLDKPYNCVIPTPQPLPTASPTATPATP